MGAALMYTMQSPEDLQALELLRTCLLCPTVELSAVDLMWNRIGKCLSGF